MLTLDKATGHPAFDKPAVIERARVLIEALAEGMGDNDEAIFDYDYVGRVEAIEFEPRSGFWPWTSGGYHVCLPAALSHHWSSGCAPAPIRELIEAGNEIIAEEWTRQFPDRPTLGDCIRADDGGPGVAFRDEAETFEMDAWQADEDCYFWKARVIFYAPEDRANETGEPEIYVDAYLNTDLNYGRDDIAWLRCYGRPTDQTTGDFKRTIPLPAFLSMTDDQLRELAAEAVATLP